jgi:hypothetical protein
MAIPITTLKLAREVLETAVDNIGEALCTEDLSWVMAALAKVDEAAAYLERVVNDWSDDEEEEEDDYEEVDDDDYEEVDDDDEEIPTAGEPCPGTVLINGVQYTLSKGVECDA